MERFGEEVEQQIKQTLYVGDLGAWTGHRARSLGSTTSGIGVVGRLFLQAAGAGPWATTQAQVGRMPPDRMCLPVCLPANQSCCSDVDGVSILMMLWRWVVGIA